MSHYEFGTPERIVLMLALMPHVRPQLLDVFFTRNETYDRRFAEFGGIRREWSGSFLPTVETALFLLAGDDMARRFRYEGLFDPDHYLLAHSIIQIEPAEEFAPFGDGQLRIAADVRHLLTTGHARRPDFGPQFPAKRITTQLTWDDLVLNHHTREQLSEITAWLEHGDDLLSDPHLGRKLAPGFRCLFSGPPGTGKTLTACLFGKISGRDVYRVDLSLIVSKYIGETEKNLEKVFKQAENKDWILFFDEADALFGKRTDVHHANDRFANQEVSYLLQRVEHFPGLVVLATNLKSNMDESFTRRFQSLVNFPMPSADERRDLWERGFSPDIRVDDAIDLRALGSKYELSGGAIVNVVRHCSLLAIRDGTRIITEPILHAGIRKELLKEGRSA